MAKKNLADLDMLIAKGEQLAKPCLLLQSDGHGQPVGKWRGEGQQPRPKGYMLEPGRCDSSTHLISVDPTWLKEHGVVPFDGPISVYERSFDGGDRCDHIAFWQLPKVPLSKIDGEPLFGVAATSFPPFEALCMHGGASVEEWLRAQGLRRIDYGNTELNKSPAVRAYRQEWHKRTPWWEEGADGTTAVLGGWHRLWPEDDFYMPPDIQLAIWTFRDSEPWIEVWRGSNNFRVFERIT